MTKILEPIKKKINELMRALIIVGIILTILAVLIAWSEYLLRLLTALFILVIAYSFFYGAYKLWGIKKLV
jgi:cobalamin synthase